MEDGSGRGDMLEFASCHVDPCDSTQVLLVMCSFQPLPHLPPSSCYQQSDGCLPLAHPPTHPTFWQSTAPLVPSFYASVGSMHTSQGLVLCAFLTHTPSHHKSWFHRTRSCLPATANTPTGLATTFLFAVCPAPLGILATIPSSRWPKGSTEDTSRMRHWGQWGIKPKE